MSSSTYQPHLRDIEDAASDERHIALSYLDDAWTEAVRDGLDEDCLVQAALSGNGLLTLQAAGQRGGL